MPQMCPRMQCHHQPRSDYREYGAAHVRRIGTVERITTYCYLNLDIHLYLVYNGDVNVERIFARVKSRTDMRSFYFLRGECVMNEDPQARVKAARAAYAREWRKKNPEKVKKYNENYWLKKAKEMEVPPDETDANSEKVQG